MDFTGLQATIYNGHNKFSRPDPIRVNLTLILSLCDVLRVKKNIINVFFLIVVAFDPVAEMCLYLKFHVTEI